MAPHPKPARLWLLRKHIALPQQHGVWVMWGGPLVVGAAIGGRLTPALLWLTLASLGALLALQPLTILVKVLGQRRPAEERAPALFWLAFYVALAAAGGLGLWLAGAAWALLLGLLALPVLVWQMALVFRREERGQMGVELVGAGALALNAGAAHGVAVGSFDLTGLMLWVLCWLQAAGAIVYIFLCLEYRRLKAAPEPGERLRLSRRSTLYNAANVAIVAALAGLGWVPAWAVLPFLLMLGEALYGGLWRPPVGAKPVVIGLRQTAVSVLFYLLLIGAYGLARV
jgi:hypothetical protein